MFICLRIVAESVPIYLHLKKLNKYYIIAFMIIHANGAKTKTCQHVIVRQKVHSYYGISYILDYNQNKKLVCKMLEKSQNKTIYVLKYVCMIF